MSFQTILFAWMKDFPICYSQSSFLSLYIQISFPGWVFEFMIFHGIYAHWVSVLYVIAFALGDIQLHILFLDQDCIWSVSFCNSCRSWLPVRKNTKSGFGKHTIWMASSNKRNFTRVSARSYSLYITYKRHWWRIAEPIIEIFW